MRYGDQPTLRTGAWRWRTHSGRTTRVRPFSTTAPATQYVVAMRVQSSRIMSTLGRLPAVW